MPVRKRETESLINSVDKRIQGRKKKPTQKCMKQCDRMHEINQ